MVAGADWGMLLTPPWSSPMTWYWPGGTCCAVQFGVCGLAQALWFQENWSACDHAVPSTVAGV